VSIELQLLLGTLKLKGTDLAVTKDQASTLLPLWNNIKTISQNMAPAQGGSGQGQGKATPQPQSTRTETQQQLDALIKQIQAAMTSGQISAIAQMKITQAAAMTIMQEQGITMGGAGNGNPSPQGTPPAGGPGGAGNGNPPPQGTPPAGGQPPSGGQQSGNGQMATPPAGGQRPGGGMVPSGLIDALIQLLEATSGTQTTTSTATPAS
jgi:hypothetical protein